MPFNIPNEGVPFYRPVAPEVPVAPRGAEGDRLGSSLISAMTQHAIAMENSRVDQQKMIQDADLKARALELDAKKYSMDYDLKKQYYSYLEANADARLNSAKKGVGILTDAANAQQAYQDSINEFDAGAMKAADQLKLTDAKFQAEDPIGWAANKEQFKRRFGAAVVGQVPNMIKQWDAQADQQKIPFAVGSDFMPPDAQHPAGWQKPLEIQNIPAWQLARDYQDPTKRTMIENGLKAAGQHMLIPNLQRNAKGDFEPVGSPKEIVAPSVQKILDSGKSADFTRGKSEVPEPLTRKLTNKQVTTQYPDPGATSTPSGQLRDQNAIDEARQRMDSEGSDVIPGALPGTSSSAPAAATPSFEPTKTDQTLAHARAVLAVNPNARDEVMRRLQDMGISPDLLTA